MAFFEAAVLGLIALAVTPGWLFYFDVTPKIVLLLAGAAVLLLHSPRRPVFRGWFPALLLLSLISVALSTILSGNAALSLFGTSWRRFGLATQAAILLFAFLGGRDAKTILRGIATASAAAALYGIAQYFGWDPILPASAYHIGEGRWTIVRPPGTLGYATYFANWLVIAALLAAALAGIEKSPAWRRFAWTAAALCAIATVFTGSRAGLLGLVCGAGLLACRRAFARRASLKAGGRPKGLPHKALLVGVLVSAAATAFYFSPPGGQLRSRARWFAEDPWGGARPMLWRDSLHMASARLAFGHGPEVFTAAFPAFESKKLAEAYPDFSHESPHNIFLDALVSQGLTGFLIFAALCFCALRYGDRRFVPALAAGLVAHQFSVFTAPTALLFYVVIALAARGAGSGITNDSNMTDDKNRSSVPLILARAPVALVLLYLAVRLAVSDHALARTYHSMAAADLTAAGEHYRQYERWRLPGTAADLWFSRALAALASHSGNGMLRARALPEAIAAGERATHTAEDPFNAWYSLSAFRAAVNDAVGVEASLRAAITARPNWFKPHWALVRLLYLEGRVLDADIEAVLALDLNAGDNEVV